MGDLYKTLKQMHKYRISRKRYDSPASGYHNSSDDQGLEPLDIELIEQGYNMNKLETPMPTETPFTKCLAAFWNLFKYIIIFLAILWIIFLFFILFQPSMHKIRTIISYIDPISAENHPVAHRVHSKQSCSEYNMTKFTHEFNVYLLFHFFRWFVCSLIYRN